MCNGGKKVATDVAYKLELQTGQGSNKVDVYQAVIFGLDYYGLATSLPVQLRDNGVEDFDREHSLGWYSIFGAGILNDEHGVVIETA